MSFLRNATDGKRKKKQVIPGAIIAITIFRSGVGPIDKDKSSIAPSHVTHARVCCENSAQRKTDKMASEIGVFVEGEEN